MIQLAWPLWKTETRGARSTFKHCIPLLYISYLSAIRDCANLFDNLLMTISNEVWYSQFYRDLKFRFPVNLIFTWLWSEMLASYTNELCSALLNWFSYRLFNRLSAQVLPRLAKVLSRVGLHEVYLSLDALINWETRWENNFSTVIIMRGHSRSSLQREMRLVLLLVTSVQSVQMRSAPLPCRTNSALLSGG